MSTRPCHPGQAFHLLSSEADAPLYADVGDPLPTTRPPGPAPGETRPAAVAPQYPEPRATAAKAGQETAYDDFKKRLYETTGTKYILSLDFVDQQLIGGPTKGYNRGNARFDLGIDQDLWAGGQLSFDARGGNSDLLDALVPHGVNTNQFGGTPSPLFVLRLAFYQSFFDDKLIFRVGKFDVGDFVDYNRFGSYNFLAYSLAHNPTIPLPGNTLGAMVTARPARWLVLQAGFSNSAQTALEPGFDTLDRGDYFSIYEVALRPKVYGQDGTYRFIGWYDTRALPRANGTGGTEGGRGGLALSFDQNLSKKFGVFARYGYAGWQDAFEPVQHWSAGFLWTGPVPSRPADTLGLGVMQNFYGDAHRLGTANSSSTETLIELYYQYELTPYTTVVPVLQWVIDPGGTHRQADAILGVHVNVHL